MEKLYRQLPWLDMGQALDYLQRLTNTPITEQGLLQLGRSRRVDVYVEIDPRGLTGTASDTKEEVTLIGMQQVLNPDMAFEQGQEQTCAVLKHGDAHWIGLLPSWSQKALFKSADIQTLAAKMNDKEERSDAAELEGLRQQLELVQANLEEAKASRETLHLRSSYTHQLLESTQAENAQLRELLADSDEKLKQQTIEQPRSQVETLATGLTFPYATKELVALRAAALKYWANHTPDKRQPTQVEIQLELCELLGLALMRDKSPPRKAVELAAVIKPSTMPDA